MQNNPFYVAPGQSEFSQDDMQDIGGQLGGLMSMNQQQLNSFASQTPGAPQQPGRVNAPNMGGMAPEPEQDFFSMLASNISRNFGAM